MHIATAGLSGPVYRTDVDMSMEKVTRVGTTNDTTFVLGAGLKYRIVDTDAGTVFIKMIPTVGSLRLPNGAKPIHADKVVPIEFNEVNSLKYAYEIPAYEVYKVAQKNLTKYNQVIVNQLTVGAMLLPIKIRRPREFNGVQYERQFSTDLSLGPYLGYRFKFKGNNYNSFTTLGAFAGPTFIDYVSTTNQAGSPSTAVADNMYGFTYGLGLVHELNGFQIGLVYGSDRVSGRRVKEWPYDGQSWFSLAIGYNFLATSK